MKQAIDKIPKRHLDEFLKLKTDLIKSRTQLAAVLFVFTFTLGSLISYVSLGIPIDKMLIGTWTVIICVSGMIFALSRRVHTIQSAKFTVVLFMIMCLGVLTIYYVNIGTTPFNVGMVWIFAFIGFSLMFPWAPNTIIGVLLVHIWSYTVVLMHRSTYVYRGIELRLDLPDYLQAFIMMLLSFILCFIVSKRERIREVENFILLKDVEEKNQQMQRELELATRIHSRLIPHSSSTKLADIAVTYIPLYYMSGDYAKFFFLDKNKLIFIICDVTGHGVSAALLVNAINAEFERLAKEGKTPGNLLKEMDRFIKDDFAGVNMYLTAFCGLLDYSRFSRKFVYSSYGHPPQYIYHFTTSKVEKIIAQTSFLGLPMQDDNIYENTLQFEKGDQVLLFTDGVIESKNAGGKDYGAVRLERFIRENAGLDVVGFNKKLINELNGFSGNKAKDDIFVLNIKTK